MMKRRKTRVVTVGGVKIGGTNPVCIQSMTKTDTRDTKKTIAQIKRLEKAGCEIVRVAVKDIASARAIKVIKKKIRIPLVADIHFDFRLALESIKSGSDKIRVNPGNISKPSDLKAIVSAAKKRKIPMRIGINSGSLPRPGTGLGLGRGQASSPGVVSRNAMSSPQRTGAFSSVRKYINFFERQNFRDIIISLKSSDVRETVESYRKLAVRCDYPFHLGVTAAGPRDTGVIKSSVGIGALLLAGIGDTVRVSLTGDPVEEVSAAKKILQAVRIRKFAPEIISCPACGRAQVDLCGIVKDLERRLMAYRAKFTDGNCLTIAVMGCEVNGPGEAKEADIGIAFGKGSGILFKKGKVIRRVKAKNAIRELIKCAGLKR